MPRVGERLDMAGRLQAMPDRGMLVSATPVGIEVEMEQCGRAVLRGGLKYWKVVRDGSLRDGGVELVLREPLAGVEVTSALDELSTFMRTKKHEENIRTSLHIHVDVRDMQVEALYKMLLLNCVFEPAISAYCGDMRRGNVFCIETMHTAIGRDAIADLGVPRRWSNAYMAMRNEHKYRYMGTNLCAIAKYGSVEYRTHPSTVTKGRIIRWINMLLSMQKYANNYRESAITMLNDARMSSRMQLTHEVFGRLSKHLPATEGDIDMGFDTAMLIACRDDLQLADDKYGGNQPEYEEEDEDYEEEYDGEDREYDEDFEGDV